MANRLSPDAKAGLVASGLLLAVFCIVNTSNSLVDLRVYVCLFGIVAALGWGMLIQDRPEPRERPEEEPESRKTAYPELFVFCLPREPRLSPRKTTGGRRRGGRGSVLGVRPSLSRPVKCSRAG